MRDRELAIRDTLDCLRPLGLGVAAVAMLLLLAVWPVLDLRSINPVTAVNWSWVALPVKQFATSTIFGTLVTAAFGAFAGAFAANRVQTKRTAITELNSVSAAIMLCFTIGNRFMSLKKQHVRGMKVKYDDAKKQFLEGQRLAAQVAAQGGRPQIAFLADFQTLTPLKIPTDVLERTIFEKISIRGRALAAAVELSGAIDSLQKSIEYRNDLIADVRNNPPGSELALAQLYFGLPVKAGLRTFTDERFFQNIEAIAEQTDDCIFFAGTVADDLRAYGNARRRYYARRLFYLNIAKFEPANWSQAEKENLIPPREEYAAWLKGFVKQRSKSARFKEWLISMLFGPATE